MTAAKAAQAADNFVQQRRMTQNEKDIGKKVLLDLLSVGESTAFISQ